MIMLKGFLLGILIALGANSISEQQDVSLTDGIKRFTAALNAATHKGL